MSNKLIKNKYTVKEFCKKYNETNVVETKNALIDKIMNPHYVPYEMKITICEKIIEKSYYKKSKQDNIEKIHVNSPAKYMLYCLWLVKQYTYIEMDFSNSLEEFNLLNEHDLLNNIIKKIPEKEHREFQMILEMIENDTMQNEYEMHAFISNQIERFGELFGHIVKPALDRFSDILENVDESTIDKIVDKLKVLNVKQSNFDIFK